ncbi:MAG: response regulator transcription factor [Bacteroidetes bacterium]|nr:response regulator transcription factor [Bacteroidota bacterium]
MIVDDEPLARSLLKDYVLKVPSLNLVAVSPDPVAAMEMLKANPVELLFLDIQMPEITGISLLKIMKKKPLVVLTTAYSEYALESYELDVVDYLLKPITFQRFLQAVDKVSSRLQPVPTQLEKPTAQVQPFIFVKDGTKMVKVNWDDILYIEGLKDYVTIHTPQQKIISLQRLKSLEEQLPADRFIRIHNSFIVSLNAIESIQKNEVHIGGAALPISDSYRKVFRDFIERNHLQ